MDGDDAPGAVRGRQDEIGGVEDVDPAAEQLHRGEVGAHPQLLEQVGRHGAAPRRDPGRQGPGQLVASPQRERGGAQVEPAGGRQCVEQIFGVAPDARAVTEERCRVIPDPERHAG